MYQTLFMEMPIILLHVGDAPGEQSAKEHSRAEFLAT